MMNFFSFRQTPIQQSRDSGTYTANVNLRDCPTTAAVNAHIIDYPANSTLSYAWNFGSLAGLFLVIQIVTGAFLAAFYEPTTELAFDSIEITIMRDVNYGWMIRYMHSNGASFYFGLLYLHMARTLKINSHVNKPAVWNSGVLIYILSMAVAFLGYVLPWGQMSLWGATVITSLFSTIPKVGPQLVCWIWGDFSVAKPTLHRFFMFHVILPFVIVAVVVIHIILLHRAGSSNPENNKTIDPVSFFSYFFVKDAVGFWITMVLYFIVVFWCPDYFGHPDNYKKANALETPAHIVPEWYFLPFYAILRCVEDKDLGVILMFGSIAGLFVLPAGRTVYRFSAAQAIDFALIAFWIFAANFLLLGFLGAAPATGFYVMVTRVATVIYFTYVYVPATISASLYIGSKVVPAWNNRWTIWGILVKKCCYTKSFLTKASVRTEAFKQIQVFFLQK